VRCVYKDVALVRETGRDDMVAILSYDEKPSIQAIGVPAPDVPPVPGKQTSWGRDHEYIRHGTVSLMAAIDLLAGQVYGYVVDRHRSRELGECLDSLDQSYEPDMKIRVVLAHHSAHITRETRRLPGRYSQLR